MFVRKVLAVSHLFHHFDHPGDFVFHKAVQGLQRGALYTPMRARTRRPQALLNERPKREPAKRAGVRCPLFKRVWRLRLFRILYELFFDYARAFSFLTVTRFPVSFVAMGVTQRAGYPLRVDETRASGPLRLTLGCQTTSCAKQQLFGHQSKRDDRLRRIARLVNSIAPPDEPLCTAFVKRSAHVVFAQPTRRPRREDQVEQ